jgi:hypothetical protein
MADVILSLCQEEGHHLRQPSNFHLCELDIPLFFLSAQPGAFCYRPDNTDAAHSVFYSAWEAGVMYRLSLASFWGHPQL